MIVVFDPRALAEDLALEARDFDKSCKITPAICYGTLIKALNIGGGDAIAGYQFGPGLVILDYHIAEEYAQEVASYIAGVDLYDSGTTNDECEICRDFAEIVFDALEVNTVAVTGYKAEGDLYDMIDTEVFPVATPRTTPPTPPTAHTSPTAPSLHNRPPIAQAPPAPQVTEAYQAAKALTSFFDDKGVRIRV